MGGMTGDAMGVVFVFLCLAATLPLAYSQGECRYGWYGPGCASLCPPGCLLRCHRQTGECTLGCRLGRFGDRCERWCTATCKRGACHQESGKCMLGCSPGTWGPFCRQLCPEHCSFPRICHKDSGLCVDGCMPSYWGESCTRQCPSGCKDSQCLQYSGVCRKGCNYGLLQPLCREPCPGGRWGESCQVTCPAGCKDGSCNQLLGTCNSGCQAGMFGDNCDQPCPPHCKDSVCEQGSGRCTDCRDGLWGSLCDKNCSLACNGRPCGRVSGECRKCPDGCQGNNCDAADACLEGCKSGLWSSDCSKNCSQGCSGGLCESDTGRCTGGCMQGYWGLRCDETCGEFCLQCKRETGACQSCLADHYKQEEGSPDCQPCPGHCSESSCSMDGGGCLEGCQEGYWGDRCTEACPSRCSNCTDSSTCIACEIGSYRDDSGSCQPCSSHCLAGECGEGGECSQGCEEGYRGPRCQEECQAGCLRCDRYQDTCLLCQDDLVPAPDGACRRCPGNCKGDNCNAGDKSCVDGCRDGRWGPRCDRTCSDHCLRCAQDGSACQDCEAGFQADGWRCERCSEGCAALCECSQCKAGYFGPRCTLPCSPSCLVLPTAHHPVCNKTTGSCTHGCRAEDKVLAGPEMTVFQHDHRHRFRHFPNGSVAVNTTTTTHVVRMTPVILASDQDNLTGKRATEGASPGQLVQHVHLHEEEHDYVSDPTAEDAREGQTAEPFFYTNFPPPQ